IELRWTTAPHHSGRDCAFFVMAHNRWKLLEVLQSENHHERPLHFCGISRRLFQVQIESEQRGEQIVFELASLVAPVPRQQIFFDQLEKRLLRGSYPKSVIEVEV